MSNVEYTNVSDESGFAAEVKLGVALGIDLSLETPTRPRSTPPAGQQRTWVVVSGVFGAVCWLALTLVARATVSTGLPAAPWYSWVAGTILVAGIQAALSSGLWFIRTRS